MKTITAIYEDGVFRPTEPVDLPEHCRVRVEAMPNEEDAPRPKIDLASFSGTIENLPVDPLEFQRAIRAEWDHRP